MAITIRLGSLWPFDKRRNMVIRFLCPNGHQLTAPETMAGKAGKCPKCGLAFAVPTLEEIGAVEAGTGEPPAEEPAEPSASQMSGSVDLSAPNSTGSAKSGTGEVFVFLCPNGHKLNGPPTLKGKAGQCPHCGAKFRIPSDEDLAEMEEQPPAEEVPEEEPDDLIDAEIQDDIPPDAADEEPIADAEVAEEAPPEEIYVDPPPEAGHALGYVFARIWDQRYEGSEVELYLKDGDMLSPEYYCDNLSCREYGVFANRNGDDEYSFTLINWDDVRKVLVKKIPQLPRPMFR